MGCYHSSPANNGNDGVRVALPSSTSPPLEALLEQAIGRHTDEYDYLLKILLLGDSAVGKSSIMSRYCHDDFQHSKASTVGLDYMHRFVMVDRHGVVEMEQDALENPRHGSHKIKVQLWDTAGQERFKAVTRNYFKGVHCYIVVFDITNRDSFMHVQDFLHSIDEFGVDDTPRLLVGNKCDLRHIRVVKEDEAVKFAASCKNVVGYLETSAKTADNVTNAINILLTRFLAQMKQFEQERQKTNE